MEYRVLGPLQVLAAGHQFHIGGLRSQRILAMLVIKPNQVVSVGRLADAAWGEEPPPATARRQVQNRVGALRAMLGPHGTCLLTCPSGYSLAVGPDELDADQFDRLVLAAAECGEPERRAAMLRDALALWRGPALDGLDSPVLTPAADLLNERRLQVLGEYFRLQLGAGRPQEIIPELTKLKAEHPLREEFLVHWMLAVSAVGRKAEALKAFHEFRSRSIEQLGIEPGNDLQRTHLSLLRERPAALACPAETAEQVATPPVTLIVPRQLPRRLSRLVARKRELTALSARMTDPTRLQVIVVHGAGGVGKTALALYAAHALADCFPDGQLFVDLHGFTPGHHALSADDALGRFLRALGLRDKQIPSNIDEASSLFRSATSGRRLLVMLDNARGRDQVMPLLPGSAGCAVVVTSRNALTAIDEAHRIRLRPLSERDALVMLEQHIGTELVAAEPAAAADIARHCGYLPLALKIASSGLQPAMSLRPLADRLADANHRLDHLDQRESSVRATISASYDVLRDSDDPVDKLAELVLLLLSLLDGPDVSQGAAEALLDESDVLVERALGRLADANLIDVSGPGRYRIHDLIRLYSREQACRAGSVACRL